MAIIQGGNAPIILELSNMTTGNIIDASALLTKNGKVTKRWLMEELTISDNKVTLPLTQQETIDFVDGVHVMEFKYILDTNNVYLSEQTNLVVSKRLDKDILGDDVQGTEQPEVLQMAITTNTVYTGGGTGVDAYSKVESDAKYATKTSLSDVQVDVDSKQPKGEYATSAQLTDLQDKVNAIDVPTKLPNPFALVVNGTSYDGSKAVELNIDGNGGVVEDNSLKYIPQVLTAEQIAQVMANLDMGLVPIDTSTLPADYPTFTVTGESPYKHDFYITPRITNDENTGNYISILNHKGEILKYKETNTAPWLFRKYYNSRGEIRYTYMVTVDWDFTGPFANTELYVCDKDLNVIDTVRMKADEYVEENHPAENHDYIYIDDGHYIVACYYKDGDYTENLQQEIKYNKVVWSLNTLELPELHNLSTATLVGGDYAHFNSIVFTPDGNLVISYRQVGIVKINKETKKIMWVIGKNRNDFTGIPTALLPLEQHDCKFVRKDGSFTIFDNTGDGIKSRVLKYSLDEINMTATAEEFEMTTQTSGSMGSATLVNLENLVFDVNCGGGFWYFEEYDFKNNQLLMKLEFDDVVNGNKDMYRVWRDVDLLYAQIQHLPNTVTSETPTPPVIVVDKTALQAEIATSEALNESDFTSSSWTPFATALASAKTVEANTEATQMQVDNAKDTLTTARNNLVYLSGAPTPIYSTQNESFDGTRYIDTNIKLFDTDKSFSIVTRKQPDYDAFITNREYLASFSCWNEALIKGVFAYYTNNYNEQVKFNDKTFDLGGNTWRDSILSLTYDSSTDLCKVKVNFIEAGQDDYSHELTIPYSQINNNLLIGAREIDSSHTLGQFYKGTIKHFQVYDKALSDSELATVIETMKA